MRVPTVETKQVCIDAFPCAPTVYHFVELLYGFNTSAATLSQHECYALRLLKLERLDVSLLVTAELVSRFTFPSRGSVVHRVL